MQYGTLRLMKKLLLNFFASYPSNKGVQKHPIAWLQWKNLTNA